jgi:excisionase family DNA binding protein
LSGRLVDSKAVAAELGVPRTWVERQARAETIPHVHLGRYIRFDLEEVRAWVDSLPNGGVVGRGHQPPWRSPGIA